MNAHQVLVILVVDTRVLGCVADSLQKRRFTSISSTDYKDTKAIIFRSKVIGIKIAHDRRKWERSSTSRHGCHSAGKSESDKSLSGCLEGSEFEA